MIDVTRMVFYDIAFKSGTPILIIKYAFPEFQS
jgi:hypothetical protein